MCKHTPQDGNAYIQGVGTSTIISWYNVIILCRKSLTLDSWTKEQVEVMKENGNIKSNALYNPDEIKNPPPTNMIDSERDSDLEKYIRCECSLLSTHPPTDSG